jgi:hypothetical protein
MRITRYGAEHPHSWWKRARRPPTQEEEAMSRVSVTWLRPSHLVILAIVIVVVLI